MTVELQEETGGKALTVRLSGKLSKEDYGAFVPEVERLIREHGTVRLLVEMRDFHGWDAGALWEDLKFDVKHFRDVERIAFVGDRRWQKGMAAFCKPFTTADIRYFDRERIGEARRWIASPAQSPAGTEDD
jgi:hypothetical protein